MTNQSVYAGTIRKQKAIVILKSDEHLSFQDVQTPVHKSIHFPKKQLIIEIDEQTISGGMFLIYICNVSHAFS
jgi:hypothetical protein